MAMLDTHFLPPQGGRLSRSDEAVAAIENMISQNGWPVGHKLPSQRALAETLEFSRPTIREALVAMETMGRVSIRPGKGVFLAERKAAAPVPEAAADGVSLAGRAAQMYQFRYAVEPAIAGLVAVNATAAQVGDMEVVVASMRAAVERHDLAEFARQDFTFHSIMVEAANNLFFTRAISPFLGLFHESQTLPLSIHDGVEDTLNEHEAIMHSLRKRDSLAARAAMERHIQGVARRAGAGPL